MSHRDERDLFDGLLFSALVPREFRPSSDDEVEAMLDALGPVEVYGAKLDRMLAKISGAIPRAWERTFESSVDFDQESAEAREMAALYRARGEALPPDLEAKLKEMERRASKRLRDSEKTNGE